MVLDLMTEIAKDMLLHLPNIPESLKAEHLVQMILMPRQAPKNTGSTTALLGELEARGQSVFSKRLSELRFKNIERYYPEEVQDKARLDSPSYFCRVLDLRNKLFQKIKFSGLAEELGPSELMRLKKLFINDLTAAITGVEEEHIEWLLSHIQIKS